MSTPCHVGTLKLQQSKVGILPLCGLVVVLAGVKALAYLQLRPSRMGFGEEGVRPRTDGLGCRMDEDIMDIILALQ